MNYQTSYRPCWKYEFFGCENSLAIPCEHGFKPENCTKDFIDTFSEAEIKLLRSGLQSEGWLLQGIEQHLVNLSKQSPTFKQNTHLQSDWLRFQEKQNAVLEPFPVGRIPEGIYHMRGSEFGSRYIIGGIVGKFSKDYMRKYEENIYSIEGTLCHAIQNDQPDQNFAHNNTLSEIGVDPISREDYCEKRIEYEIPFSDAPNGNIIVRGHADALLKFGDNAIAILDFKRAYKGFYEKVAYKNQLCLYAMGIEQQLGRKFDYYLLITVKRPFPPGKPKQQRPQEYHITYVDKKDPIVEETISEVKDWYSAQKKFLDNKNFALKELERIISKEAMKRLQDFNIEVYHDMHKMLTQGEDLRTLLVPDCGL